MSQMLGLIHDRYIPNKILGLIEPDVPGSATIEERIPLLRGKRLMGGGATVFVCRDHRCEQPVTDVAALAKILDDEAETRVHD
jgi:uncharacterized protein YyaL (SSP411 family)